MLGGVNMLTENVKVQYIVAGKLEYAFLREHRLFGLSWLIIWKILSYTWFSHWWNLVFSLGINGSI